MGLDEYSYLWDSSENWILQHISETKYSIVILFKDGVSTNEVLALRKIFPYFQNRNLNDVKAELESLSHWESSGYNYATVHDVYNKAIKQGLSVAIIGQDSSRYQIINAETNAIREIEDKELLSVVVEKMLAADVHVDYVETD